MKRLWILLAIVLVFGFTVLGWIGSRIYQDMPPIPQRIVTSDGQVVAPEGSIQKGQAVWQTLGGMEVGSIWGHGSYVAPDWTADWLHRECELILFNRLVSISRRTESWSLWRLVRQTTSP